MNRRILALLLSSIIVLTTVPFGLIQMTKSEANPHDLAVSLQVPAEVVVGETVIINITTLNVGTVNEANVTVRFTMNATSIKVRVSRLLSANSSVVNTVDWKATPIGIYNITAWVQPADGEMNTDNNRDSRIVSVVSPKILIVSDDDGATMVGYKRGTSLPEFENALNQAEDYRYDVWKESERGHPSLAFLKLYNLVIWTCGDFADYSNKVPDSVDATTLEQYLDQGGNILIEGQRVCWGRVSTTDSFAKNVLHTSYLASIETASLRVVDSANPVVADLPLNVSWNIGPKDCSDSIRIVNGGQVVIAHDDIFQRGAVVVFNGAANGMGSVVLYSFPIYWMSPDDRNVLILSSVAWLSRFGVEVVGGEIINGPANLVHFVYTDPDEVGGPATYDAAAGALIFSICENPQSQGFATTKNWLLQSGQINSTEIDHSILVIAGNPGEQPVTAFYESIRLSPVHSAQNLTHYLLADRDGNVLSAVAKADVSGGHEDLMVIQVCSSGSDALMILYGFSWRGTWGAGLYFSQVMAKSLADYSGSYYILRWEDNNQDGVPQVQEIQAIRIG